MEKYALITGASSGIGRALVDEFAADSYNLILVAHNERFLQDTAEEVASAFPDLKIKTFAKNLSNPESAHQIFDELNSQNIAIEALVNDAGVGMRGDFSELLLEKQINIIRLNVEALTRLTHLFVGPMLARGHGEILNVGSIAGFEPGPLLAVYHASKAFVVSFTEALAEELKDTGLKITCLCPGATKTKFFDRAKMQDTNIVKSGMMMEPSVVAKAGYKALKEGDRVIIPGIGNKAMTFMRRAIPLSLQAKMNKKFYEAGPKGR